MLYSNLFVPWTLLHMPAHSYLYQATCVVIDVSRALIIVT